VFLNRIRRALRDIWHNFKHTTMILQVERIHKILKIKHMSSVSNSA